MSTLLAISIYFILFEPVQDCNGLLMMKIEVRPEDIFGFFFNQDQDFAQFFFGGGNFQRQRVRQRRPQQRQGQAEQKSNFYSLIQFLPLILLLFSSFIGNIFTRDPAYSFYPSHKYRYEVITRNLQLRYYVEGTFNNEYMKDAKKFNNVLFPVNLRLNMK